MYPWKKIKNIKRPHNTTHISQVVEPNTKMPGIIASQFKLNLVSVVTTAELVCLSILWKSHIPKCDLII